MPKKTLDTEDGCDMPGRYKSVAEVLSIVKDKGQIRKG